MTYRDRFRVPTDGKFRLADVDPNFKNKHEGKDDAAGEIDRDIATLRNLQYLLYAGHQHSMLIVLQGLDASGKDGTISHVFTGINPQGARVHAFKVPSQEEADHDFLWRAHIPAPAKGEIVIYNRSHYEDVLVPLVHDQLPKHVVAERYDAINAFEKNLAQAGTTILKFYLHISADEQLRRFRDRLDDPARNWKISEADYTERAFFAQYLSAYEAAFQKTSTDYAPWFVIPANHKWFRNLAVAKIVVESLEALGMSLPSPRVDLDEIRRKYYAATS